MVIFRYLSREVIAAMLATVIVLLIIFISNQFVHYLNDAAQGKITTQSVFELMSIQVPLLLGFLLPLSWYLAILLTIGRWCADHELIALFSCGYSRAHLLRTIVLVSVVMTLVVGWLMLYVESRMQVQRAEILKRAVSSASLNKISAGRFQTLGSGSGKVFYTEHVSDNHAKMRNVLFVESQPSQTYANQLQWDIVSADTAYEAPYNNDGNFLIFENGNRYIGVPGELDYKKIHFKRYGLRLNVANLTIGLDVPLMTTTELLALQYKNNFAAAELQWRIAMPISLLILTLLAIPLSEVNPRSGKFGRFLPAILLYIVYANLMLMTRAWIQKGIIAPWLGMWWVHGLFLLLAIILIIWRFKKR